MQTRKSLQQIALGRSRILGGVLGGEFKVENVSCVPSRLGPPFMSNGTGNRGVDLKYRLMHQSKARKLLGVRPRG